MPTGLTLLAPRRGCRFTLRTGTRVVAIDRDARRIALESGETMEYERLLLATGGAPRRLPFGGEGIVYYRTVPDYRRVHALPVGKHVAVIGGGRHIVAPA